MDPAGPLATIDKNKMTRGSLPHQTSSHIDGRPDASPSTGPRADLWQRLEAETRGAGVLRAAIVVAGLVIGQFVLYGPSLIGQRILLPLDILKTNGTYIPQTPETRNYRPQNRVFADEVLSIEMRRQFAVREVRAGRLPLWNPYLYCGAPFMAANNTAVFSPYRVPDYLFPGPRTIAWVQMLKALVAGIGAYLFFRVSLGVRFLPAVIGAWCFPLIGFLILWRGYPPSYVVTWLPWLLLGVELTVRRPAGFGPPLLALVTAATLVSGHLAVAAHVLLTAGLFAVWRLMQDYLNTREWQRTAASLCFLTFAWAIGFLLSAVQNLPTMEYLQFSYRVAERRVGQSEEIALLQPGFGVLPQFVWPPIFGNWDRDSWWIAPGGLWRNGVYTATGNPLEGAPAGYAGLLMTLVFAPLGLCLKGQRAAWWFWLVLGVFAASFLLGIPIVERLFSWPPFNVLKNNRFTFATAWATTTMAVLGLEAVVRGEVRFRLWQGFPILLLVGLGGYFLWRYVQLPPALTSGISPRVVDVAATHAWFRAMYLSGAVACGVALAIWWIVTQPALSRNVWVWLALPLVLVGELLWQHHGKNPQCDPELYYPQIEALVRLTEAEPGRVCGWRCLPACLAQSHWLRDVRGYDGADPVHIVRLLLTVDPKRESHWTPYALTQHLIPFPSPVLDMLNLRYRIHRGSPPSRQMAFTSSRDYWVERSDTTLPRPFVPESVVVEPDLRKQFAAVTKQDFSPREVAYVGGPLRFDVPDAVRGRASVTSELPSEVNIEANMETPGVVVLADMWFPGWSAYVDGERQPILRTNYAIRGVEVPAGKHEVVFRYEPPSLAAGGRLTLLAGVICLAWFAIVFWSAFRGTTTRSVASHA